MQYDRQKAKANRLLPTMEVLAELRAVAPEAYRLADVVGRWVWVQFEARPSVEARQALLELGFHWNHRRQVWQHCGGKLSGAARSDPRDRYGRLDAEAAEEALVDAPA